MRAIANLGGTMAAMLAAGSASAATLIDFDIVARGSVHISGGTNGDIASATFTNSNGITAATPPAGANYSSRTRITAALAAAALDASTSLAGMASTGGFSTGGWSGEVFLTGTGTGINVFNLTADQFRQINNITFRGTGSGAIVNVAGGGDFTNFIRINASPFAADRLVFNFAQASGVGIGGLDLAGTLLAPNATVTLNGGTIGGSVIGNAVRAEGVTIRGAAFGGLGAVTPVPEPATWATMIAGFALVGFALRRRARPIHA